MQILIQHEMTELNERSQRRIKRGTVPGKEVIAVREERMRKDFREPMIRLSYSPPDFDRR